MRNIEDAAEQDAAPAAIPLCSIAAGELCRYFQVIIVTPES
jgi:hypothetical protein